MSSTPRVLVEGLSTAVAGSVLACAADDAEHLVRVLRVRAGDVLTAFDGKGHETDVVVCRVASARGRCACDVRVERTLREGQGRDRSNVIVLQAVAKGDRLEEIVRHSTELGVAAIWPVITRRTVARPDARDHRTGARLRRIAVSAASQCGRADVPEIAAVSPLEQALARVPAEHGLRIVPYEQGGRSLSDVMAVAAPHTGAVVLIGPEGGFDDDEVQSAREHGFTAVTLGPRILRTETAALAILAILCFARGDLAPRQ